MKDDEFQYDRQNACECGSARPGSCDSSSEKRSKGRLEAQISQPMGRRSFFKGAAALASSVAASGYTGTAEAFFKKHYKELTQEERTQVLKKVEAKLERKHGVDITLSDPQADENVHFVYGLDLSKCNGSRKCVTACVEENNQSRDPALQYIKVLEMDIGTLNPEKGSLYYSGEVPKEGKFYMPVQCHQCDNPPCTKACPIEATWKEKDGIVVIDSEWCIGCRYCMAACPYEARRFNFQEPLIKKEEINPVQGYLSNRVKPKGVVEKCHFCLHRTRKGQMPACQEACPTGARKFGNLKDPKSEVTRIFKTKRVFILKEELNTKPRFFYYFG